MEDTRPFFFPSALLMYATILLPEGISSHCCPRSLPAKRNSAPKKSRQTTFQKPHQEPKLLDIPVAVGTLLPQRLYDMRLTQFPCLRLPLPGAPRSVTRPWCRSAYGPDKIPVHRSAPSASTLSKGPTPAPVWQCRRHKHRGYEQRQRWHLKNSPIGLISFAFAKNLIILLSRYCSSPRTSSSVKPSFFVTRHAGNMASATSLPRSKRTDTQRLPSFAKIPECVSLTSSSLLIPISIPEQNYCCSSKDPSSTWLGI